MGNMEKKIMKKHIEKSQLIVIIPLNLKVLFKRWCQRHKKPMKDVVIEMMKEKIKED